MPGATERAVAHVDVGAIERNVRQLRGRLARGAELCAVVKADGYGHGDVWVARAAQAAGASWLAVATAEEAAGLRRHGIAGRLLVMGALAHEELKVALEAGADVVVWRPELVPVLAGLALSHEPAGRARVHVKLDTGMGRLGTRDAAEAHAIADAVAADERLELVGAMTHFATADAPPGDEHFADQLERFTAFLAELRGRHPGVVAHAANSAACLREPASHLDLVRCGVAIYGLDPFGEDPAAHGLEPALALVSHLGAVKRFARGESAGYGRTWRAPRDTWVGVVPVGYGDGWRRALSNAAEVLVGGRRRPVVGTISMDNLTVDLGPDARHEPGEPVVLLGRQGGERLLAEEVARRLGTINYEVTCALLPRVRRRHVHP